ncbi:unnamed protein product [Knipowitschia caucasica]|uniref:Pentraxin (PTX) domain-containing protein n=1 Tax=Knipowitschia caucasica TaxID=637954 RepID=A0AAV2LJK3_KNICA
MKFMVVLVGAGALAFLGAVICIIASVYPRKRSVVDSDNSTSSEGLLRPLEAEAVAQAGPLGALHGGSSYDSGNALGLDLPSLNELGQTPPLSFSRLVCTPLPLTDCGPRDSLQADQAPEEDWSSLRVTADELQQLIRQQNQQILMDQRTIQELTGKLSECESGLEEPAPEHSVDVWSANRRIMAGDEVGSTAAQLQTARAVEELARAIMDLKDRIEKLEAEIGPPTLNRSSSDSFPGASPRKGKPSVTPPSPPAGSPGLHRPVHPAKPSSKGPARPKGPKRVEDLEGELERKIKELEKERESMRKQTQDPQHKGSPGGDPVSPLQNGLGEASFPEGFVMSFPMRTNYMYGVVRREVTEMYAFTACLWLRPTEGGIGTPFSYSVPGQPNELVLLQGAHNPVELLINDKVAQLPLDLHQDQWQHVCVSWTLRDGVWKAYQGGQLKGRGEGLAAWHPIKPGGVLILGQEQDTVGGRFDASQALVGELSQFNLWDRVLKPAEVSALADCSSPALGNIAPWTDLDVDVYGGATKESTEPCYGSHKSPNQ